MGKVTVEYAITRVDVRENLVVIYLKPPISPQMEIPSPEGTVVIGPDPKADQGKAFMDQANKMFSKLFSGESPFPIHHFVPPPDEMNLQITRDQYEALGKPLPSEVLKVEISIAVQGE